VRADQLTKLLRLAAGPFDMFARLLQLDHPQVRRDLELVLHGRLGAVEGLLALGNVPLRDV